MFLWKSLLEKEKYESLIIKSKKIYGLIIAAILCLACLAFVYVLRNEQEKINCKSEKTLENYMSCISDAEKNRFNLVKIF